MLRMYIEGSDEDCNVYRFTLGAMNYPASLERPHLIALIESGNAQIKRAIKNRSINKKALDAVRENETNLEKFFAGGYDRLIVRKAFEVSSPYDEAA